MNEALFISITSVVLAYLARYKKYRCCLEFAFLLISVFLGIRYMWGNDMPAYYEMYNLFNRYDVDVFDLDQIDFRGGKEYGWIILNILCKPIGFLGLQILLVIFQNGVIYKFIKDNVNPKWYWLSLFIYCFNTSYMVLSASMMRQYLAMCLFIVASCFIIKRKIIPYMILVLLAVSVHQSALILLPCYLFGVLDFKLGKKHIIFIVLFFVLWFSLATSILKDSIIFLASSSESFSSYEGYLGEEFKIGTGLGVIYKIFLAIILLGNMKFYNKEIRIYSLISVVALLFIPLAFLSGTITRLGFYFSIFSIVSIPSMMEKANINNLFKCIFLVPLIYILFVGFQGFFNSPVWIDAYKEYYTIFEFSYL